MGWVTTVWEVGDWVSEVGCNGVGDASVGGGRLGIRGWFNGVGDTNVGDWISEVGCNGVGDTCVGDGRLDVKMRDLGKMWDM